MLKVKDDVIKILEKENSRKWPGREGYRKSKEGKTQEKRVLYDTLYNLHKKFFKHSQFYNSYRKKHTKG